MWDGPVRIYMAALIFGRDQSPRLISHSISKCTSCFLLLLLPLRRRLLPGRRFSTRFSLTCYGPDQLRLLDRDRPHTRPAVDPEQRGSELLGRGPIKDIVEGEALGGDEGVAPDGGDEVGDGVGGGRGHAAKWGARGGGREP